MFAFIILLMSAGAILALAGAINYFWRQGFRVSLGYAALLVGVVLVFCASGVWVGETRHGWSFLFGIFVLMLLGCWLAARLCRGLWLVWRRKNSGPGPFDR